MTHASAAAVDEGHDSALLARSGLIAFAGSVVNGVAAFLVILAITNALDKTSSGLVFTAMAMFNIVFAIASLGADVGLVRFTAQNPTSATALLKVAGVPAAVFSCIASATIVLARRPIAELLSDEQPEALAQIILFTMPLVPLGTVAMVVLASTRGLGTMTPTALADRIAKPMSQLVLVSIAWAAGASASTVGVAWAMSFAIACSLAIFWFWRLSGGRAAADDVSSSDYWKFTAPQAATNVLYVLLRWADVLIVSSLAGPGPAAVYTAVSRLLIAGNFVNGAIVHAVSPLMSEALGRDDRREAGHLLKTGTAWLVAVVWPGYMILAILGEPLLVQLFGADYSTGATALAVLSLAMMVASGSGPIEAVLLMDGGSRLSLIDNLAAVTTMLVLDALLVPSMGVRGAAIGWAAGLLITNLVPMIQVQRRIGINPLGRAHFTAAAIGVCAVGLPAGVLRLGFDPGFGTVVVFAVAAYGIHLAVISRFSKLLALDALASALRPGRRKRSPRQGTIR